MAHSAFLKHETKGSQRRVLIISAILLLVAGLALIVSTFASARLTVSVRVNSPDPKVVATTGQTAVGGNVKPGDQISYSLWVKNDGTTDTTDPVTLKVKIPANTDFVAVTYGSGTYDSSTRTITQAGGRLIAGHTFTVTFTVKVKTDANAQYGTYVAERGWLYYAGSVFYSGYVKNLIAVPTPAPPGNLRVTGTSQTSAALAWNAVTPVGAHTQISQYIIYRGGAEIARVPGGITAFNNTGLACAHSYSYFVKALEVPVSGTYGTGSATSGPSSTVTAATAACPAPAPGPSPSPSPSPSPQPRSGGVSAPAPDKTAPSVPGNLTAKSSADGLAVTLGWRASSDTGSGVNHYVVERGADGKNFKSLHGNLTATSFEDRTAAFETHYVYRVAAVDGAGNKSAYATVDFTTPAFAANVTSGQVNIIRSDDGLLSISLPIGAVPDNAACTLGNDVESPLASRYGDRLVAGPYVLICKLPDGTEVSEFKSDAEAVLVMAADEKASAKRLGKYGNLQLLDLDSEGTPQNVGTKIDYKQGRLTFNAKPGTIILTGNLKKSIWPTVISILVILILFGGGIFFVLLRRAQKQQYEEYLRKKYLDL